MIDERIPILMRISEEYGIDYNAEEAEELLEIFDKVMREINPDDIQYKVKTQSL